MNYRVICCTPLLLTAMNLYAGSMGPVVEQTGFGGFYAGLGTGFTTIFSTDEYSIVRPGFGVIRTGIHKVTNSAVLFSGQAGYGVMFNQKTYLGGKGSIYYTPMENNNQISFASSRGPNELASGHDNFVRSLKPIYNIDAVLGYEIFPNFLPFVEAGVSFANVKHRFVLEGAITNLVTGTVSNYTGGATSDNYNTGYNIGIGANYQVHKNWIFSGELVYHDLGTNNLTIPNFTPDRRSATHYREEKNQAVSILASVSYLIPS
ncbi:Opacity protein and related surface antigens [Legionella pneumophila]|uniref:outer membrane protein n=1 Tax=Legionella pneumophila TaxID=446 RepID=UPI0005CB30A6|nr:outer membrane beta-barrel protein [Legionella pneumophila]HAT8827337.1 outer membrane beta-barrel protein [Legionella pneumophila subsp. pneumophila]WAI79915.1 outer membrane beta-barrel protein [Legionella pneumophila]CZG30192.1 Opacity protein and related surface antigens [Legionella pneumophila]CZH66399.1 Opacity protein and related surface antigens [Legionella pneumophila]HAT2008888.1 porin family protein [Legionella pneumophila]